MLQQHYNEICHVKNPGMLRAKNLVNNLLFLLYKHWKNLMILTNKLSKGEF